MGQLVRSDSLDVQLQAPDGQTLVIHPNEGRKFDLWKQNKRFSLYFDRDDFINASDNHQEVTIQQENDCEFGVIHLRNPLYEKLGQPSRVQLFRKNDNIFLKSL